MDHVEHIGAWQQYMTTEEDRAALSDFLLYLITECGYDPPRAMPDGRYATISRFIYTTAIITGDIHDRHSVGNRWCYHDERAARAALDAWDGTGEPEGWHRNPRTGRRRAERLGEFDGDNVQVTHIGQVYVRW